MLERLQVSLLLSLSNSILTSLSFPPPPSSTRDAGVAGILLEDQVVPKSCGHVQNKEVVSRAVALAKLRAAVLARDETQSERDRIVIIARTDSRQAVSMEETLWRIEAFCKVGADMVFCDALQSLEEMGAVCSLAAKYGKPVLANMLESGKTPILSLEKVSLLLLADVLASDLALLRSSPRSGSSSRSTRCLSSGAQLQECKRPWRA